MWDNFCDAYDDGDGATAFTEDGGSCDSNVAWIDVNNHMYHNFDDDLTMIGW